MTVNKNNGKFSELHINYGYFYKNQIVDAPTIERMFVSVVLLRLQKSVFL